MAPTRKRDNARLARFFFALSNRTRRGILRHLHSLKTPATVAELSALLNISGRVIRKHLSLLSSVGLVEADRAVQARSYRMASSLTACDRYILDCISASIRV